MERFELTEKTKLWIYGAAFGGTLLYEKLHKNHYQVEGFIDKRAEEIESLCGLSVYSVKQAKERMGRGQLTVIISVKNVFEHSGIARELIKNGITNIIYKPYAALKGFADESAKEMFELHNQLIDCGFCKGGRFCRADEIEKNWEIPKEYLLAKDSKMQTVFLPLPMLFENQSVTGGYKERNVCFLYPHIQFFRYLQGEADASCQRYLEYCEMAVEELDSFQVTEAWKENVIRNRADVFYQMNHGFLFQKDFFVRNSPEAEWNEDGYFNLKSGKHRAAFFAARRQMYIPVKITHSDAEKWISEDRANEVKKELLQQGVFELKAPVEHPFFYQMPCTAENFFYGVCCALADELGGLYYQTPMDHVLKGKKIYLNVDDYGFVSRFFRRSGAMVYDADERDRKLKEALERLFSLHFGRLVAAQEHYDLAVFKTDCPQNLKQCLETILADHYFILAPESILKAGIGGGRDEDHRTGQRRLGHRPGAAADG